MSAKPKKEAIKNPANIQAPQRRDWPGYVRSPPREINERIVQIDGASFADAARDFGHRNVVGKWNKDLLPTPRKP